MDDDDEQHLDFLSALGDEFSEALRPVASGIVPQDGYEVWLRAFEREPSPGLLAAMTDARLEQLRAAAEDYLECRGVTVEHVRTFVSRTLARWPAESYRALVDRYVAAYNAFDVEGMLALLDPGVEFENVAGGVVTARASGLAEFRTLAEGAAALFARRQQRVTEYLEEGATARARIAYEGVLAAELPPGLPPGLEPGATLRLAGWSTFEFRGGRIARLVDET